MTKEEHKCLKDQNLVEGRYPNLFMTAPVAALAGDKSQYIRNKAFDKEYYKKLIVACLKEYPESSRKEIDDVLVTSSQMCWMPSRKEEK